MWNHVKPPHFRVPKVPIISRKPASCTSFWRVLCHAVTAKPQRRCGRQPETIPFPTESPDLNLQISSDIWYIYYYIYITYIIYIYQISRVILKAMTKFLETKIAASQWSAHLKCQKMCISASFYIQPCNEEHGWQVLKLNQIETSVIKALRFKRFGFVACHNAHQARDCMIQLPHDPHVSGWSRAMKYLYPEFPLQIITA